jgi:hypothetical protein
MEKVGVMVGETESVGLTEKVGLWVKLSVGLAEFEAVSVTVGLQ